jgi:hypothetical protein
VFELVKECPLHGHRECPSISAFPKALRASDLAKAVPT